MEKGISTVTSSKVRGSQRVPLLGMLAHAQTPSSFASMGSDGTEATLTTEPRDPRQVSRDARFLTNLRAAAQGSNYDNLIWCLSCSLIARCLRYYYSVLRNTDTHLQ